MKYTLVIILLLAIFAPSIASAGIVPCGGPEQKSCNLCHLYTLVKNGIDFMLLDLILPVAVIALLIGGIFLLASRGNPQMMETGKNAITNTIIGVIIAFGSWLIIATIVNTLGYDNFIAAWNKPPVCQDSLAGKPPPGGVPPGAERKFCVTKLPDGTVDCRDKGKEKECFEGCPGGTCQTACPAPVPPEGLTHQEAKEQLDAAGITITSTGGCSNKTNPDCTSLDGVRQKTIDGIIKFKQECNCPVNISGGTEDGHDTSGACTHGNGCKLDISHKAALDNYVQKSYENIGRCFPAASVCYRSPSGQIWANEGSHWDVAFK